MTSYADVVIKDLREVIQVHKDILIKMVQELRAKGYKDIIICARFFPIPNCDWQAWTDEQGTKYLNDFLPGLNTEKVR